MGIQGIFRERASRSVRDTSTTIGQTIHLLTNLTFPNLLVRMGGGGFILKRNSEGGGAFITKWAIWMRWVKYRQVVRTKHIQIFERSSVNRLGITLFGEGFLID